MECKKALFVKQAYLMAPGKPNKTQIFGELYATSPFIVHLIETFMMMTQISKEKN